ncbi:ABC transporter permease [Pseudothermotoga thermarum]|uniref:ABC transporter permease n=1 Tax=Pseudothermotoga thermarum TaxID=119394 RepID=UPI0002DC37DE|nr:ABC transporter permease [Pseudothermotoga thermarum]
MKTETKRILKRLLKNPSAVLGFSLLIFFTIIAILAPVICPPQSYDPYMIPIVTWDKTPIPPSPEHPFGVIDGRDIFYGVVWGTRTAFKVGLTVTLISTLIGLVIGSIAGYFGEWLDEILMRITDIFLSIPYILAAIVVTAFLGMGLDKVMISLIMFGWMGTARSGRKDSNLCYCTTLETKSEELSLK